MHPLPVVALASALTVAACSSSGPTKTATADTSLDSADTSGTDTAGTDNGFQVQAGRNDQLFMVDGIERQVLVYAPESALTRDAAPMVMFFHGSNQTGVLAFENFGWKEVADTEGIIVVFPTALNFCFRTDSNGDGAIDMDDEREIKEKWANGDLQDPEQMVLCAAEEIASLDAATRAKVDHPRKEDRTLVEEILRTLPEHYPIDPKRMYLSGFSGGGSFATRMTQEMSDVFVATQSCAGGLGVPPVESSRGIPYVLVLGTRDRGRCESLGVEEIPFEATFFKDFPMAYDVFLTPLLTMLGLTASEDELVNPTPVSVGGVSMLRWEFSNSPADRGNTFQFLLVKGMQHEYPTSPLKAAELAWEFFKPLSLP